MTITRMSADLDGVWLALDTVVDPCSVSARVPLGLAEMGLVFDVTEPEPGHVVVTMGITSPCCVYGPKLAAAAEAALADVAGVRTAEVRIDYTTDWTPARMSPVAHQRLGAVRSASQRVAPIEPYDWSRQ